MKMTGIARLAKTNILFLRNYSNFKIEFLLLFSKILVSFVKFIKINYVYRVIFLTIFLNFLMMLRKMNP